MKATYRWALRTFRGGCAFALLLAIASPSNAQSGWPTAGYDLKNSRYQASEKKISPKTVGGLALNWSLNTDGDVTANGYAFVGIASNEELVSAFVPPGFWNWHFRGSVVALNIATGAISWQTYTVPHGYYGGAVWGSTGSVDLERNQLYMATGNNYS